MYNSLSFFYNIVSNSWKIGSSKGSSTHEALWMIMRLCQVLPEHTDKKISLEYLMKFRSLSANDLLTLQTNLLPLYYCNGQDQWCWHLYLNIRVYCFSLLLNSLIYWECWEANKLFSFLPFGRGCSSKLIGNSLAQWKGRPYSIKQDPCILKWLNWLMSWHIDYHPNIESVTSENTFNELCTFSTLQKLNVYTYKS